MKFFVVSGLVLIAAGVAIAVWSFVDGAPVAGTACILGAVSIAVALLVDTSGLPRRWHVVARDITGAQVSTIARCRSKRRAERLQREWSACVPMPLPGRPLYTVHVERAA